MNLVKTILSWLSRLGRCRGFGIQSPWAFSLVCEAVNTRRWNGLFADIETRLPQKTKWHERKLCRLTVKLARHYNFTQLAAGDGVPECFTEYMRLAGTTIANEPTSIMAVVGSADCNTTEKFVQNADSASVMLVYGIHTDKKAYDRWKKLQADERTGITFDVFYAGIAFFDHHIYKQHYIIEF